MRMPDFLRVMGDQRDAIEGLVSTFEQLRQQMQASLSPTFESLRRIQDLMRPIPAPDPGFEEAVRRLRESHMVPFERMAAEFEKFRVPPMTTMGDIATRLLSAKAEPEPVIHYPLPVDLRANRLAELEVRVKQLEELNQPDPQEQDEDDRPMPGQYL